MLFLVFIFALIINLFTSSHRSNSTPSSNTLSNNTISSSCIADPDELRALLALASDGETFLLAISYFFHFLFGHFLFGNLFIGHSLFDHFFIGQDQVRL